MDKEKKVESKPNPLDAVFEQQIEQKRQLQLQHQEVLDQWLDNAIAERDQMLDYALYSREYAHYQKQESYGRWVF